MYVRDLNNLPRCCPCNYLHQQMFRRKISIVVSVVVLIFLVCFVLLLASSDVLRRSVIRWDVLKLKSTPYTPLFSSIPSHFYKLAVWGSGNPGDLFSHLKFQGSPRRRSLQENSSQPSPPIIASPPITMPTSRPKYCLSRNCGDKFIPYPFGLTMECAYNAKFLLTCSKEPTQKGDGKYQDNMWPYISTSSGSYQIIGFSPNEMFGVDSMLIINASHIKAKAANCTWLPDWSHNNYSAADSVASLVFGDDGFIVSPNNNFFVSGCLTMGRYSLEHPVNSVSFDANDPGEGICGPTVCNSSTKSSSTYVDQESYCSESYGCCTLSIQASKSIYMVSTSMSLASNIHGSGSLQQQEEQCGFAAIVYPFPMNQMFDESWNNNDSAEYGVELFWAIQDYENCSVAVNKSDYACSNSLSGGKCSDISYISPNLKGYVCGCLSDYAGDGFISGTGCYTWTPDGTGSGFDWGVRAGIIIGASTFLALNMLVIWYLWRGWHNVLVNSSDSFHNPNRFHHEALMEIQKKDGANVCKIFSLKELKEATDNFSSNHELGRGGFGMVFKGILEDGTELAVKKAKNDLCGSQDDTKQFINEVTILSQVNHRNLVRLLGCCLEQRIPLLVYEYVSNGTLLEHLEKKRENNGNSQNMSILDWETRLDIAVGMAEALNYLHFGTSPPIYHRDVKSSNILLDNKFCAKVADFGISKLVPIEATHISTKLQGTPGYLDPEYFENMQISDKSDVYSFGVVLLELISAKRPVDLSRIPGDQNLVTRFSRLLREGMLEEIFDENLNFSSDFQMLQAIYNVAKVAMRCVQKSREERPNMKDVLDDLMFIRKSYYGLSRTSILLETPEGDCVPLKVGLPSSSEDLMSLNSSSNSYSSSLNVSFKKNKKRFYDKDSSFSVELPPN